MGAPRQPDDAWTFLRGGDDDEAVGPVAAEEEAVNLLVEYTPLSDPARSDLAAMVDGNGSTIGGLPITTTDWFGDEEPDAGGSDGTGIRGSAGDRPDDDSDREPDLEEILESQHYAFDQSEDSEDSEDQT